MPKPTIRIRFLLTASLCLTVLFFWSRSGDPELASAIEKGLRYYTPETMATVRVDDALLLSLIERAYADRQPSLLTPEKLRTFSLDPLKRLIDPSDPVPGIRFYRRAYPYQILQTIDNNSYLVNPPYEKYLRDPYDDILFKALYCDLDRYDEADFSILKSIRSESGDYADTHYLLGLLLLKESRCLESESLDPEIEAAAQDIADAAAADTVFSDLYAERIVFLYWAGAGDKVRKEWVEFIREHLTDDPGWRDSGAEFSNAHTTGLSLLALLYFDAGEKKQAFYDRSAAPQSAAQSRVFSGGNIFVPAD